MVANIRKGKAHTKYEYEYNGSNEWSISEKIRRVAFVHLETPISNGFNGMKNKSYKVAFKSHTNEKKR